MFLYNLNSVAFAIPIPYDISTRKPTLSKQFVTSISPSRCHRRSRYRPEASPILQPSTKTNHAHNLLRMQGSSSSSATEPLTRESAILPRGAVTIVLSLKLKTHITKTDTRALLSEYARQTLRERDVLRCDVIYRVTKKGIPKGPFYEIWITLANSQAYMQHERTSHAAKLRIYIDSRNCTDTATLLTKLAHQVTLLRPLYPTPIGWRSSLQHDDHYNEDKSRGGKKRDIRVPSLGDALEKTFGGQQSTDSNSQRELLNDLISNVGLEDVKIQVCKANAISSDMMRKAKEECEDYLKDIEKNPGIVRTGLLIDRTNLTNIVLISVHDADDVANGVFFDLELAVNYLDDKGWNVERYVPIYPDKIGWEKFMDEEEAIRIGIQSPESSSIVSPTLETYSSALTSNRKENGELKLLPNVPSYRLLYGYSAFDKIKDYIREMIKINKNEEIRLVFIGGWNGSRLQPLLPQLEYKKNIDPAPIIYKFGLYVSHGMTTTDNIRKCINIIHEFKAHGILAYGGGSVMDMGKLIGRLAYCNNDELDYYLDMIDDCIDMDLDHLKLDVSNVRAMPVMLLPTALGSGVEMTDLAVARGKSNGLRYRHRLQLSNNDSNSDTSSNSVTSNDDDDDNNGGNTGIFKEEWRHVFVDFQETKEGHVLNEQEMINKEWKTILIDSRLSSPRRIFPACAAQAALCNTCASIDVLLSSLPGSPATLNINNLSRNNENMKLTKKIEYKLERNIDAERFGIQSVGLNFRNIRRVQRENTKGSGETRDALTKANISLGIAMDNIGRPGIALRLSLAIMNIIFNERSDYVFRHILIRVTIGLIHTLVSDLGHNHIDQNDDVGMMLKDVSKAMDVNGVKDIERMLLRRSDECDVPLLPWTGLPKRNVKYVAEKVEKQLRRSVCNDLERRFTDCDLLETVVSNALEQKYEL